MWEIFESLLERDGVTIAEKRTLWLGVIDKIWYGDDKQIRVDFLT